MTVGIIGAMDEEVRELAKEMTGLKIVPRASMEFHTGDLCGVRAVVVRSGIGKVNAALCAQILIDGFHADTLINTGIAGALDPDINIGDVVISTDLVEHDMDCTIFGDPVGQIPRMDTFSFAADPRLVKQAAEANERVNPDIRTFTGRIASGDQFISSSEKKKWLVSVYGAKCAEMEGAAVAHTAYLNRVPCVVIRAISDKADDDATCDYPAFEKKAIDHSVKLTRELIKMLK